MQCLIIVCLLFVKSFLLSSIEIIFALTKGQIWQRNKDKEVHYYSSRERNGASDIISLADLQIDENFLQSSSSCSKLLWSVDSNQYFHKYAYQIQIQIHTYNYNHKKYTTEVDASKCNKHAPNTILLFLEKKKHNVKW